MVSKGEERTLKRLDWFVCRPTLYVSLPAPAAAVRAYGEEAVGRILERVRGMVLRAKEQPEDSKQHGSLQNTTLPGVVAQVGATCACVVLLLSRCTPLYARMDVWGSEPQQHPSMPLCDRVTACVCALHQGCSLDADVACPARRSGRVPTTRHCTPTRRCSAGAALRPKCSVAGTAA